MKKRLSLFLVLALITVFLCSCGAVPESAESSTADTSLTTQTGSAPTQTTFVTTQEPTRTTFTQTTASSFTESTQTTAFKTEETTEQKTVPAQTEEQTTVKAKNTCTLTIDCRNLLKNADSLKKSKRQFLPESGYILKEVPVEVKKGETAFDILKRGCKENVCTDSCKYCKSGGVQLEFSFTPAYQSYYVEGIHQLYEKDCGTLSGWMYNVNGKYPDVSSSVYEVKTGDVITFAYTVSMGDDL